MTIDNSFIDDLIKGTNIEKSDESSLMNNSNRPKIKHPLQVINCITGGGIPMTLQTEFSGPPQSGKTAGAYTMLASYLEDNPNGIGLVIDTEGSMDVSHLVNIGVDLNRTLRVPASSIEEGFASMFVMFNKLIEKKKENPDISIMVIFDSISAGGTEKQHIATEKGESAFGVGTVAELPRILKQNTSNVFPYIEKLPILIIYINQVSTTGIGNYITKVESIGGYGFKHNLQFSLIYGTPKDEYENNFISGTTCKVEMKKSKICPKFKDIPCRIDAHNGGQIDEVWSFFEYVSDPNVGIIKTGSWYSMSDTMDKVIETYPNILENQIIKNKIEIYKKNMRKADMLNLLRTDSDLYLLLQIRLIDIIDEIYPLQREVNGDYQKELIKKCRFFDSTEIEKYEKTI